MFKSTVKAVVLAASMMLMAQVASAASTGNINWSDIQGKQAVVTGTSGASFRFTTTGSLDYKGYFSAVADSASGNLTRRMWFSEKRLGNPIVQNFIGRGGKPTNACDVTGVDAKISWSQADSSALRTTCLLKRRTTYYLNYTQSAFGSGKGPTASSRLFSGASTSGKP